MGTSSTRKGLNYFINTKSTTEILFASARNYNERAFFVYFVRISFLRKQLLKDAHLYFQFTEENLPQKCQLDAGEHVFPFEFQIPIDIKLPSSFESHRGYIRYKVRAKINKPGFDQTTRRCFSVDACVDLNNRPLSKQNVKVCRRL